MKTITSELAAHIAEEVTTLATCWKVTRRDGLVMGFTDHDCDISLSGVEYKAASGFTPTSVENSAALNVDNLDVDGLLDSEAITEADVVAGLYDFAEVEVFWVNYANTSQGALHLRTGWLGEVTVKQGRFVAEVRGLSQRLSQTIGSLYSPTCRATFGDARCGVSLGAYTVSGAVSAASSQGRFTDTGRSEDGGYFAYGTLTFTSGENAGLQVEVKEFSAGEFILSLPMPYAIAVGDSYTAVAGCDRYFSTCTSRFGNAVNFRGEPHVPGLDKMLETASTRSA